MVSSTNPNTAGRLNTVSFLIMVFQLNFTGEVYSVQNNARFDTPIRLISSYNVAPEERRLVAQFERVIGETEDGLETEPDGGPVTYSYQLGTTLTLTEVATGYQYFFVPFQGVVTPDKNCTF